jgi:hypothetical protein
LCVGFAISFLTPSGLTQAEILLHVLEERMLMRNDVARYDESHLACFRRESFQNQWRREMGGGNVSVCVIFYYYYYYSQFGLRFSSSLHFLLFPLLLFRIDWLFF